MEKKALEFNYWTALDQFMKDKYPTKTVFLYDKEASFSGVDEEIPENPITYIFDSVEEFKTWINDTEHDFCNILQDMAVLWENGERVMDIMYDLRG